MVELLHESLKDRIRLLIIEATGNEEIVGSIKNDEELFSGDSGLDSVDLVSVIVLVEREFDISIPDEATYLELFKNINAIVETIILYKDVK